MKNALIALSVLVAAAAAKGQFEPPAIHPPDKAAREGIEDRTAKLGRAITMLQRQGVSDPILADVQVFHKAAEWIARHNEFFHASAGVWTLEVLDLGLLRASQALRGESPWYQPSRGAVARGYRSRIDGSVQPFIVTYPKDYGKDPRVRWRVDVVLHGRDATISEVKFIRQRLADKAAASDHSYVTLEVFGRGNNAYRWAGESDVLEAIDAFVATERWLGRGDLLDPSRVVLRGFSMGGAGTWHLGLHRPDRWCVIGPGAGFTTTRGYWKELPDKLPSYIEACLHIYDAVDYASNAAMVPVVAYGGSKDPQLQAAKNIAVQLNASKIPMTLLVGEGLEHRFPPEQQTRAEAEYVKYAGPGKGRNEYPQEVQFTTYTLKYPGCDWVEILGLHKHYHQSLVKACRQEGGFTVETKNVRILRLGLPAGDLSVQKVKIDNQDVNAHVGLTGAGAWSVFLEHTGEKWRSVAPQRLTTDRLRRMQKIANLQGPIDDAFTDGFLCVRGTGTAWHNVTQHWADAELQRFQKDWDKFFRGALPIKNDTDLSDEDVATKHLILFGDPASNSVTAQVIDALPLSWAKDRLVIGGVSYDAATTVPAMIYPSPLNPSRYVVLNSGHTFRTEDLRGTNARLFPRLGDYAVLAPRASDRDPAAANVIAAGLFDDFWRFPQR